MTNATKPTGKAATLAQIKAFLAVPNVETQFNLQTGSILNWYELDEDDEPITHNLNLKMGNTVHHVALTSLGDELVAEYDNIEYALISTGIRLCNQDSVSDFIEAYAKPYELRQKKRTTIEDSSMEEALKTLAIYAGEVRAALSAAKQMLEHQDPYFHQTTLANQIALLSLNQPPVLDAGNLIDSVNRESIIKGSELYLAASALDGSDLPESKLVARVIDEVRRLNGVIDV